MFDASSIEKLTDKAVNDAAFRARAVKDPASALAEVGAKIPAGMTVQVHVNEASKIHVALPLRDGPHKIDDPAVRKVFEKAWSDPAYKARLLKEPFKVISEAGARLPTGLAIVVHEDTAKVLNLTLPYVPPAAGELSDADLEMVAGGKGTIEKKVACVQAAAASNHVPVVGAIGGLAASITSMAK
jgi:hypothetical protein